MANPYALITMAYVSTNEDNPYAVFCEYIKFCIFSNPSDKMTLKEIGDALSSEFGLYMPKNVLMYCLRLLEQEEVIRSDGFEFVKIGDFNTESFEQSRRDYENIENSLLGELVDYVAKFGLEWDINYAREQLLRVLDSENLAYDIFVHDRNPHMNERLDIGDTEETFNPDDEENGELKDEPLYREEYFVGNFIGNILNENGTKKEYLQKVCEGLMICVGAYQIDGRDSEKRLSYIDGTTFYFDTRLLLRFVGCGSEAAISATQELVKLIQDGGGSIYYYPHTLKEMEYAFDKAIRASRDGALPLDSEMRLYVANINSNIPVLRAKKSNLQNELASSKIYCVQLSDFDEKDKINFSFDRKDLEQYMLKEVKWEVPIIENDALSIWETHMQRRGNYEVYFGSNKKLCVFVTNNSRLINIATGYRAERKDVKAIENWNNNRLPIITDIRLTCRLWNPSKQGERLSLLFLTANVMAAQRPTRKYINCMRELAEQIKNQVPEYAQINLAEYFDETFSERILEKTEGKEENLDIGTMVSTIEELAEIKAQEQEKITEQVIIDRDVIKSKYDDQTNNIVESAIEHYKKKLGFLNTVVLYIIMWLPLVAAIFTAVISMIISLSIEKIGGILRAIIIIAMITAAEFFINNCDVRKKLLNYVLPKIEASYKKRIQSKLSIAEEPYEGQILNSTLEQNVHLSKAKKIVD